MEDHHFSIHLISLHARLRVFAVTAFGNIARCVLGTRMVCSMLRIQRLTGHFECPDFHWTESSIFPVTGS